MTHVGLPSGRVWDDWEIMVGGYVESICSRFGVSMISRCFFDVIGSFFKCSSHVIHFNNYTDLSAITLVMTEGTDEELALNFFASPVNVGGMWDSDLGKLLSGCHHMVVLSQKQSQCTARNWVIYRNSACTFQHVASLFKIPLNINL